MGLHGFPMQSASLAPAGLDSGLTVSPTSHLNNHAVLPVMTIDGVGTGFIDARSNPPLKIKGSFTLASFAKNSNKFSPY
jgi:hypothetical protein